MQQAFAAPDRATLTPAALAGAGLDDADWEHLRLAPAAGLASRSVSHDLAALWHALANGPSERSVLAATAPAMLLVWCKDLSPHFRLLAADEFAALKPLLDGASFGEAASQVGESELPRFGQRFAQWLNEGLFSTVAG